LPRDERLRALKTLENLRSSRILVYVLGDRRGLETKIASDSLPFCLTHLLRMGRQRRIDLFLYGAGGITMAGYGLVNLIREFCDSFGVIIPFKAHSTATLVALGADEIVMTKMGQLSPIDPSVVSPLGPQIQIPGQPGAAQPVPVNVEDVRSYIDIARKELGVKDEDLLVRVLERLSQTVHPLVLGSVNRIREQTSFLATTLLKQHMDNPEKITNIVEIITRGRFSHDYLISRKEAKDVLGLNVVEDEKIENETFRLYRECDGILQLSTPYNAEAVLGANDTVTADFNRALIEADDLTHVFRTRKKIDRVTLTPPQVPTSTPGFFERILSEQWLEDNNI